jgi:hypothetical protein
VDSFGTFDFINYDNNLSYYESSNYSYLCGVFDVEEEIARLELEAQQVFEI